MTLDSFQTTRPFYCFQSLSDSFVVSVVYLSITANTLQVLSLQILCKTVIAREFIMNNELGKFLDVNRVNVFAMYWFIVKVLR